MALIFAFFNEEWSKFFFKCVILLISDICSCFQKKKNNSEKILYDKIVSEKYVNSVFSEHPKTKMTVRKFKVDESSRQTSGKLQQNFKISITK